jgi:hypothetical protein
VLTVPYFFTLSAGIGVSGEEISNLEEKLKKNPFVSLGEEFSSYYKINKHLISSPLYIAPKQYKLLPNEQGDVPTFQYIPIIETVKLLVNDQDFKLLSQAPTPEGCFYDVKDGTAWKENSYFKDNPEALSGQLYSDAVQLDNPLGATKGVNKALNVYFTLLDIPKVLRSKIQNIFLVLSVRESELKENKENYARFFKPLVDDLKKLEAGVQIGGNTIKMGLVCYSADNLESSSVGGFSQCFSSYDICRICHKQHKDVPDITGLPKEMPWTVEEYDVAAASLETGLRGEFGLNSVCLFNDLQSFHSVKSMPLDIMHDFHEKVAAYDGMSILKCLVKSDLFTFKSYNQVLHDVKLGDYEAADRPLAVSEKNMKLPGKAMAVCQHLRLMPFFVWRVTGGSVEQSDVIDLLVLLARIQEILMADKVSTGDVAYFEDLVVEYFHKRKICDSQSSDFTKMTPKYHYLGIIAFYLYLQNNLTIFLLNSFLF